MASNTKGSIFIFFFRLSSFFLKNKFLKIIGFPVRLLYKVLFQWILGIDIPDQTKIGKGFDVYHGQGLIINSATIIGENVTVRQNTTIGNSKPGGGAPVIENNVKIGANSVVIGEIIVGENSIIGAGSVVVKNVPKNAIVAGNPAKLIKQF
jgi:putative colanic acid biosynthesis acetyltransferase WcaB